MNKAFDDLWSVPGYADSDKNFALERAKTVAKGGLYTYSPDEARKEYDKAMAEGSYWKKQSAELSAKGGDTRTIQSYDQKAADWEKKAGMFGKGGIVSSGVTREATMMDKAGAAGKVASRWLLGGSMKEIGIRGGIVAGGIYGANKVMDWLG